MKLSLIKISIAASCALITGALGFTKPEYAPVYQPPVAAGEAKVTVGGEGADLSGAWNIRLDDEKTPRGTSERWFEKTDFTEKIILPDALQNAGFGSPVTLDTKWMGVSGHHLWFTKKYEKYRQPGNIKVPFFLQPERRFIGEAWYQKSIVIGEDVPKDKDLILTLERPHWSSTVWLNGELVGSDDSLGVPHVFNLGRNPKAGTYNLVVKVNNTLLLPVGDRAHSVSDETQGAWNGIIGEMRLDWRNMIFLERIKVSTDYKSRSAEVEIRIENTSGKTSKVELEVADEKHVLDLETGISSHRYTVHFGNDAELWSEFTPVLHDLNVSLHSDQGVESEVVHVGLRNWETEGQKLLLNGKETFMRGTLDCCIFPLTGYPPTDVDFWMKHLGKMRDSGINHVRFHSWCPPRAAFIAGDRLGMYLMPETHIWGDPSNPKFDGWVEREGKRILDTYGNHPSLSFFTHGNEPGENETNAAFLTELTREMKAYDSRMLHTGAANTIQTTEDEFTCSAFPRGPSGWKGKSFTSPYHNPYLQHEVGQWCAYPNFDEMKKYTGPLKPKNFEIFFEQAEENGVLHQWKDFVQASGKLQAACYKEDCEAALASEGVSGTQLLGISDFSGQGTSLVGYLDAFYDEKGYFTKEEFSKFWNPSVPLARMKSYVYKNSDVLTAPVLYAYFGDRDLIDQTLIWEVSSSDGKVLVTNHFENLTIRNGRNTIGSLSIPLKEVAAPANYTLTLRLKGTEISNHWEFMVCQDDPSMDQGDVLVHREIGKSMEEDLAKGKSVLFIPGEFSRAHPKMSFAPVYWNKFLFSHNKDRVTLGTLIRDQHPLFRNFPTKGHTTWNWEAILNSSYGLAMEKLPAGGMIVQPIDDWNRNRQLGFIFEYRVGTGKLLVSMADLFAQQDSDPAAKQLLSSMLTYMNSSEFAPATQASLSDLADALKYASNKSTMLDLGASVKEVSRAWSNTGGQAIDGDDVTGWQGKFTGVEDYIIIDLGREQTLQGILLTNTTVKEFEVRMGNDLENLQPVSLRNSEGKVVSSLVLDEEKMKSSQKIGFEKEAAGRYLKIDIKAIHGGIIDFNEMDVIFVIM
ncbi:discoidin domain-containing protein [Luteolibacter algae]|uniref:beta-galactosidase n=1 Tax=Luteolibacter algae TaxID=454151 RepID=A0ABW5D6A3_9BACT